MHPGGEDRYLIAPYRHDAVEDELLVFPQLRDRQSRLPRHRKGFYNSQFGLI